MNVERMELLEYWQRSWTIFCWSFGFGVGAFRSGRTSDGGDLGIVEDDSGMEGPSGWRMTSKKLDVVEAGFEKVGREGG